MCWPTQTYFFQKGGTIITTSIISCILSIVFLSCGMLGNGSFNCLGVGSIDNVHFFSVNKIVEAGHTPHSFSLHELTRFRTGISDHLDKGNLRVLVRELIKFGCDNFARPTPGCAVVDDHDGVTLDRFVERGLIVDIDDSMSLRGAQCHWRSDGKGGRKGLDCC